VEVSGWVQKSENNKVKLDEFEFRRKIIHLHWLYEAGALVAPMLTVFGGAIIRIGPPDEEVVVEDEEGDVIGIRLAELTRVRMTLRSPP